MSPEHLASVVPAFLKILSCKMHGWIVVAVHSTAEGIVLNRLSAPTEDAASVPRMLARLAQMVNSLYATVPDLVCCQTEPYIRVQQLHCLPDIHLTR